MKPRARVFISYRRDGGGELARLVRDALQARGHKVFMDVEDLRAGPFNTALFTEIESATDIVVILSPGSLERCSNENDWVRLEVAHALNCKKNLIPVRARGFQPPVQPLPDDMKDLLHQHGLEPSFEYFNASMDKLSGLLVGRVRPKRAVLLASAIGLLAFAAAAITWITIKKANADDGRETRTVNNVLPSNSVPASLSTSPQTNTPAPIPASSPAVATQLTVNPIVQTQMPAPVASPAPAATSLVSVPKSSSEPSVTPKLPPGKFTNSIGMELVEILPGKFMMGSPEFEAGRRDGKWSDSDELAHEVTIGQRYYISATEVTQAQFESIMGHNYSPVKGSNLPVHQVNWNEATEFCALLSAKEKLNYRLPSEAEWEYACRAGTTTPYSSGKTEETLKRIANYAGSLLRMGVRPVASLEPNQWGLYDMHGNVSEWTRDQTLSESVYYLRGGSWAGPANSVRSAARDAKVKTFVNGTFGFRVVAAEK